MRYGLVLGLWIVMTVALHAEGQALPKLVADGFEVYKKEGASKAIDAWMAGSPVEKDVNGRLSVL